jgi:predicted metalloprotease with PDZ domain
LCASLSYGQTPPISYDISLSDPQSSLLRVRMSLPPGNAEREIQLPVWNALYQVRDFAQYVRKVQARNLQGQAVEVRKTDKTTWRISQAGAGADIEYETVAELPGAYGAQFTSEHAFLNLAMVLMYEVGKQGSPVQVSFSNLPPDWRIATPLHRPKVADPPLQTFAAASYDELVDSPFEIGKFQSTSFIQGGATYRIVVHGEESAYNMSELAGTVRRITAAAVEWMNDRPYEEFTFIYHFPAGPAGGGMEHAHSTAIDVSVSTLEKNALALPSVTAHEFFHLWNVKRIRPQSLEPVDYTRENYTTALWFSEGVTSTVEDYILLRAGLLDEPEYLRRLAQQIRTLLERPAHLTQSSEQSSLETWFDKYAHYRLPERSISYYNKGAILGVLLDLRMRQVSGGTKSLRDLFHRMNQQYAKQGRFFADSEGVRQAAEALTGADFGPFFRAYVSGVDEIPYDDFFEPVGLKLVRRKLPSTSAGFEVTRNFDSPPVVSRVEAGSAAESAGVQPGDRILSLNEAPVPVDFGAAVAALRPGDTLRLRVASRKGERDIKLRLVRREEEQFGLVEVERATAEQRARRAAWLGIAMTRSTVP